MGQRFEQITDDAKTRIREVSAAEAKHEQSKGAVVIDVRESEEFAHGHAKDAVHLSKGVLELHIENAVPNASTRYHLLLWRRSSIASGRRQLAKNGLYQRRLDGRWTQGMDK